MQNANDCVNMIVKSLKKQSGATVNKNYQKKQKTEQDANNEKSINQIYLLLEKVNQYEEALKAPKPSG